MICIEDIYYQCEDQTNSRALDIQLVHSMRLDDERKMLNYSREQNVPFECLRQRN